MSVIIPTPTSNDVPSADIKDVVFAGAKMDEFVSSDNEKYTDRKGVARYTAKGLESLVQNFLLKSGYEFVSDYVDGPVTFTARNQITAYDGEFYRVSASVDLPYTTSGNTSTSWKDDEKNLTPVGDAAIWPLFNALVSKVKEMQSGDFSSSQADNLLSRMQETGMFSYVEIPGEAKGIACMVFGDSADQGNKAGIMIDDRGRLQTFAIVDGLMTAQKVSVPFTMGTGYFNNQFEDRVVRFPCAGQEDDDLSPGLLLTWDTTARKYRVGVMSPFMAGNKGYPVGSINDQMNLLASFYDLGYGLNHSFDHFNTTDVASLRWGKVAIISPGTSGDGARKMSALITAGSYVDYEQATYLLEVNGQNLIRTINAGNMNRGNIAQWIKLTRLSDSTNATPTMNDIPEVGVLVNTTTGNAEVWMKVPYYSPRVSVTVLSLANPAFVSVDWSDWKNNNLRSTEPSGLTYCLTNYPINNQNYVKTNSGAVVYAPNTVIRIKDAMSASSTYNRMSEFLEYGFTSYSDYLAANRYSGSGITVTKSSTGTYSVSGCTLSGKSWKVKPPVAWVDGSSAGVVAITSSASGSFSFTLKNASGTLIDIPDGCWIDFHVS
ncbi:MAG: hypothetical protein [Bacteriophage sp.]|nr:MAG: hypothetical protein [Bacteriophage sp.]